MMKKMSLMGLSFFLFTFLLFFTVACTKSGDSEQRSQLLIKDDSGEIKLDESELGKCKIKKDSDKEDPLAKDCGASGTK